MKKKIYVFESNTEGRHIKGTALVALARHGAMYGQGTGLQGESYAIPVKDDNMNILSINKIEKYVDTFIKFAKLNPDLSFEVTRIGCGAIGYEDKDIAPLFAGAPDNCVLPVGWRVMSNN